MGLNGETIPEVYRRFFIEKGIERDALFETVAGKYRVGKALYPGSFAHITPSFYIPEVVYLDTDKRCKGFFSDARTIEYVRSRKTYDGEPKIRFHGTSFEHSIDEEEGYFDLLISQYSGFVSRYCARYLKPGGFLLADDSHGDATWAYTSGEFTFLAAISDRGAISETGLDSYFRPAKSGHIDMDNVLKTMKGPAYTAAADSYLFSRKRPE